MLYDKLLVDAISCKDVGAYRPKEHKVTVQPGCAYTDEYFEKAVIVKDRRINIKLTVEQVSLLRDEFNLYLKEKLDPRARVKY